MRIPPSYSIGTVHTKIPWDPAGFGQSYLQLYSIKSNDFRMEFSIDEFEWPEDSSIPQILHYIGEFKGRPYYCNNFKKIREITFVLVIIPHLWLCFVLPFVRDYYYHCTPVMKINHTLAIMHERESVSPKVK